MPSTSTTTTTLVPGYRPANTSLLYPSTAPLYTFYMYRVQGVHSYPPENQNMGNLPGVMWYLHNEIVNNRAEYGERRYGKTRIQRYKVRTRAPQPLADAGMHFGVRYAFDAGACTGPFDCEDQFSKYGYFVGCNKVTEFPTQQWADKVYYENAVWYSLPGKCSTRLFFEHDTACELNEPGGACADPTGQGNCTYSYEFAGEISIDELEGIDSYREFSDRGGWEYNNMTDYGIHMDFWNDKYNTTACDIRTDVARSLFKEHYPDDPGDDAMQEPPCDFRELVFYDGHLPDDP